ncbi:MAG: hypothetical protein V4660_01645 [Pseudomonadota bacterium]
MKYLIVFLTFFLFFSCGEKAKNIWIFSGKSKTCTHVLKDDGQIDSMEEIHSLYPACTTTYNTEHKMTILDCTKDTLGDMYVFSTTKEICEDFRKKYYDLKNKK